MKWLASTGWLALIATAFVSSDCVIVERGSICVESQGIGELYGDGACDVCAARSCCAQANACLADPACADLMRCLQTCEGTGDAGCYATCRNRDAVPEFLAADLIDCMGDACADQGCVFAEEQAAACESAGRIPDAFGANCAMCIRRAACGAATTCANDPECAARLTCMADNCRGVNADPSRGLTPGCFDSCRADGKLDRDDTSFLLELGRVCRDECRVGREFSCVGRYAWPQASSATVDVQRQALNRITQKGFEGLSVRGCGAGPNACTQQGDAGRTDAEGLVTVANLPTGTGFAPGAGFVGYLRFETDMNTPDGVDWRTTLLIHTRPEWRDRLANEVDPYAADGLLTGFLEIVGGIEPPVAVDFVDRGALVGGMVDCRGRPEFFATNVMLEIDEVDDQTRIAYVNDNQAGIDGDATATTTSGQFVAINVPPGVRTARMRDAVTGDVLARSENVNIEPGVLTVVQFYPQPQ